MTYKDKEKKKQYDKQWRLDNKEKKKQYDKQYKLDNKEKIKEKRKQYRLNNKEKIKQYDKKYRLGNKEKLKQYSDQYKLDNKEKIKQSQKQYLNSEKGFLTEMYNGLWGRYRRKVRTGKRKIEKEMYTEEELKAYEIRITKEQFFELWEDQKEKFGVSCPMTGVTMTTFRPNSKNERCPTNLSVDRLDNDKGYTSKNIIFVSSNFNSRKNSMGILDCVKIINEYKKRFPMDKKTLFIELSQGISYLKSKDSIVERTEKFKKENEKNIDATTPTYSLYGRKII